MKLPHSDPLMIPVVLSWSSGKDSALCLYYLLKSNKYVVHGLLTTITKAFSRVSMHGVRESLLDKQIQALGMDVEKVYLPYPCSNNDYEKLMLNVLNRYKRLNIYNFAFGDIYLSEVREYREKQLLKVNASGIFPLWNKNSIELAHEFISSGFKAIITCVDSQYLDKRFVGKFYDFNFLNQLPPEVDPCGENGEFHTFVFDGPIFNDNVKFSIGEVVCREDRFFYCDFID